LEACCSMSEPYTIIASRCRGFSSDHNTCGSGTWETARD
jgi:hypothetical protein